MNRLGELQGPPPLWQSVVVTLLAGLLVGVLQLGVFHDRLVPLTYALPLLLCLWHRDLRLLYVLAVLFSVMAAWKNFWLLPHDRYEPSYYVIAYLMQLVNISVAAGVVHGLIYVRERLRDNLEQLAQANCALEAVNEELTASNEELAVREEEVISQNEELRSQAEELEQQAEELRQQTEESEQQSAELQQLNVEMARRDKGLHILLESARRLRSDLDERAVMDAICQAAVQVMGDAAQAAAVVYDQQGVVGMRGHAGFGITGMVRRPLEFARSFTTLILESGQTAALEDVAIRSDLELPQPAAGRPFHSVLGTPIWLDGRPTGALEIYSHHKRQWSDEQFSVAEWLAAQSALAIQAINSQQQLALRQRESEEASLNKTRFLAAVSHDVRTPANAICLLADLIEMTAREPQSVGEIPQMAADLKSNARALIELVSDVLDLARFDTGKFELEPSEFSLTAVLKSEGKHAMPVAQVKGLILRTHSCDNDVWVRTDRMNWFLNRLMSSGFWSP